jgi:hypothetical protein
MRDILISNPLRYIKILIVIGILCLLFISLFSRTIADRDLWGYLSFGRIFWESGYFPFQDIFSYTPTKPLWVYHEWLTGVIFYPILKYLGPAGLQLLRYIVIVLTIYLMYLTALKKGGNSTSALIALIPATVLISFGYGSVVRAQIFTYLFFILTIYIIEIARKNQKWTVLLWILPIQVLWCNFHGGFVAGLGVICLYALGEGLSGRKFVPFIIILFPAILVTLINPYGIEYWRYTIHAVTMPRPEINEWFSIFFALKINFFVNAIIIFIALSIICLLFFIFQGRRYFTETLIITVTIYLGAKHIRHITFFAIVFGAFLPVIIFGLWETFFKKTAFFARLYWLSPIMLAIFFLSANLFMTKSFRVSNILLVPSFSIVVPENLFPVGALKWMEENNFEGNILPLYDWGEFLIWSCYPNCRVAMDGRYETVYSENVYKEYFDFLMCREGWQIFLHKYPHDLILMKPNAKIQLLMLKETQWKLAYSDPYSVLFIRKNYKSRGDSR